MKSGLNCITEVVVYYTNALGVVNIRFYSVTDEYYYATNVPITNTLLF